MQIGEGRRARAATALGIGAGLVAMAALAMGFAPEGESPPPVSADAADLAARRADAAFDGAEALFAARLEVELGRSYRPAQLKHFLRATAAPCAGAALASGPYFCADGDEAGMDLAVIVALEPRLRRDAGAGIVMAAARLSAERAAVALGPGADADCLAGVFAQDAEARIGPVSPVLYGRILDATASALAATSPRAEWRDPDFFAADRAAREAAFARGRSSGRVSGCV